MTKVRLPVVGDEYERRARLQPVLIVILPIAAAIGLATASVQGTSEILGRVSLGTVAAIVSTVGLAGLLAQVGRDAGKRREAWLWQSWGGSPTTQMLRRRAGGINNPVNRERYHAKLRRLVSNVRLPTAEQELADPDGADLAYDACAAFLRNATRDRQRFPLIFEENVNYGFRRNLWAMRGAGIACAATGMIATAGLGFVSWNNCDAIWTVAAILTVADACLLTWWLIRIRPSWVFIPAKAYAERLLEACDSL